MSAVVVAGEAVGRAVPLVAGALGAGGLAVAALPSRVRMRAELRRRWRTWALAAPVFLGALFLGAAGAFALAAALGVIAAGEYVRMAGLRRADHAVLVAASVVLPGLAWPRRGRSISGPPRCCWWWPRCRRCSPGTTPRASPAPHGPCSDFCGFRSP